MEFPNEYIKKGEFILHSGSRSNIFYDINALLTDKRWLDTIIGNIPKGNYTYVGIATAGAIIASHLHPFAMIKDNELKGRIHREYCLIDDVCTTEGSLRKAIDIIGFKPEKIFVILDRRSIKTLELKSMFDIKC